jgi:hypothetical protein
VGTAQAAPPAPSAGSLSGEVLEVRNVDSYTYLRLKTASGELWAAVPTANVAKGARVTIAQPMMMANFESKTLKKTFDQIAFGNLDDPSARAGATNLTGQITPPHGSAAAAAAGPRPVVGKVAKAEGQDGRTVAEVVAGATALKGKTVVVRGQVVKFNGGIMGKNWVHLRDGSGKEADGSNDVLVTTQDSAAVGDVIVARGMVRTEVDLGSGYRYAVIVEDASLRK